ncbi:MAG: hypothetical protein KJ808_10000 [Acidobacteria bacterium]|nr:hypothetical protein [Acidobacteriota bacterium]MBU4307777.1 hypothetical protein [Acidobacteriota bacterium]MBU4400989.1 hypothetical protein [Planctomycetota bacterium]MCG2810387.1 hypothetical protein [Candidatus Aminicenantes bacterium]
MSKKQQKLIALLVTVTFVWLLQVSVMPLNAANAPAREKVGSASTEQAPSFLEQEGDSTKATKVKSKRFPWLIVAGAVVVAAVLVLVVFKTKKTEETEYDITGEWKYSYKYNTDANWRLSAQTFVCTGDKKQGTFEYIRSDGNVFKGSYTVEKENVSFTINYSPLTTYSCVHTGTFEIKDKITGTFVRTDNSELSGTWELVRATTN